MPVQTVIKTRRDTAANWLASTAVLAVGEAGLETDTRLVKYGNGADVWVDLEYASTAVVKEIVKNSTGSTIPKGSAVYVSGSNGDNALISLADADTEATSSKTLGLTTANITDGSLGTIITNGLLKGVDTSTATAGDSVWLSSTAGGIVFATPPAKPAHLVYIGVVVRVHATNGAILVKVQNGYEVNELHDVNITDPQPGDLLSYDDASGLWVNSAPAPVDSLPSQTGNAGELLVTDGTDASWSNTITANSASVPAIIAKGAASQSGNIQEWQDSTGAVKTAISSSGFIDTGYADIDVLRSTVTSPTAVPIVVKGAASQSANLQQWQDSTGTVKASVSSSGSISVATGTVIGGTSGSIAIRSVTGSVPLTVRSTSGSNIQEWVSSDEATILASISQSGQIYAIPSSPAATDSAKNVGYVGMPQVSTSSNITALGVSHAGKHIYSTTTGLTHTISSNASSAMEIGTTFVFINPASVTTSIAITSDTLILAGTGTTGTRTLGPYGMATALKITATSWIISGNGLS